MSISDQSSMGVSATLTGNVPRASHRFIWSLIGRESSLLFHLSFNVRIHAGLHEARA